MLIDSVTATLFRLGCQLQGCSQLIVCLAPPDSAPGWQLDIHKTHPAVRQGGHTPLLKTDILHRELVGDTSTEKQYATHEELGGQQIAARAAYETSLPTQARRRRMFIARPPLEPLRSEDLRVPPEWSVVRAVDIKKSPHTLPESAPPPLEITPHPGNQKGGAGIESLYLPHEETGVRLPFRFDASPRLRMFVQGVSSLNDAGRGSDRCTNKVEDLPRSRPG